MGRTNRSILAATALVCALVAVPQPAAAVTTCQLFEGDLIVQIDEANSDAVELRVIDDVLFVNGLGCGTSPNNNITVIDVGSPKIDHLVIDLTTPFLMNGDVVFVNLALEPDSDGTPDRVTLLGSPAVDNIVLGHNILTDSRNTPFAGGDTLRVVVGLSQGIALELALRGGEDTLAMPVDNTGASFRGELLVRGGKGDDVLRGGPGIQEIKGGGGDDFISGGPGRDVLWGNSGSDNIRGNRGRDTISGGKGRDTVSGGPQNDTFHMADGRTDFVRGSRGRADTCVCDDDDVLRSIEESG